MARNGPRADRVYIWYSSGERTDAITRIALEVLRLFWLAGRGWWTPWPACGRGRGLKPIS